MFFIDTNYLFILLLKHSRKLKEAFQIISQKTIVGCPWVISWLSYCTTSKGPHEPKAQTAGAYLGFFSMKHALEYCYSPLDGMLVHRWVPPSSMTPVPIYTPSERGTKWSNVPCLKDQRDKRGLNPRPPDLEFEVLTARRHSHPLHSA